MYNYELLGTLPRNILKSKKMKRIIIILIGSIIVVTILVSTNIISRNNVNVPKKAFFLEDKEIQMSDFEPLDPNNKNGPITINKNKDDGTKINLSDYIYDVDDNKVEYFLFDNITINALKNRIDKPERYLCELEFTISEDGGQAYDISCPMYYSIAIDKAFYGRYKQDTERCVMNYKGERVPDSALLSMNNCGYGFEDKVKASCEGKTNCYVLPFRLEFTDSCPGKRKYLHLQYHCAKNKVRKKIYK